MIFFLDKWKTLKAFIFTTTPICNYNSKIRTKEETYDEASFRKKKYGVRKVRIWDINSQALRL